MTEKNHRHYYFYRLKQNECSFRLWEAEIDLEDNYYEDLEDDN